MISYFKYTAGNAFTLSGVDYTGFVNVENNIAYTGRTKTAFSQQLSSKENFLARSILEKREFDNSPSDYTTNLVNNLEYSPRNVLSNDFLKKNFTILYKNNLSLFSLGQVYNNSYLDTTNFKDDDVFGGFFGLSSTTIDDRNDDNNTYKKLNIPYQIDPFAGADKNKFPDLFELDNAKSTFVETYDDGFVYTISTDTKTFAFSGTFGGSIQAVKNSSLQSSLKSSTKITADKANGLIYIPTINSEDDLTYIDIYDGNIYRDCTRLKLVDRIIASSNKVINQEISFGRRYKAIQVIGSSNNLSIEISPNNTSEILRTIRLSELNDPEYVKLVSRNTDDVLLILTKSVSNISTFNAYFIDLEQYVLDGIIPTPKILTRVDLNTSKYDPPTNKDSAFTVFGTSNSRTGYFYPLFDNEQAANKFSNKPPSIINFPQYPDKDFYFIPEYVQFSNSDKRPNGYFIYRDEDSLVDIKVSFSDYDSNIFEIRDNGNLTERFVSNPEPVTSFLDPEDLLFPPSLIFSDASYRFNSNDWKFNTNKLESNRVSFIDHNVDSYKDKTYVYYQNVGRLYYITGSYNKKRLSLVPANLQSFFNPDIFNEICETSLGINLNSLIQDILRDTINIYNNFTKIPKAINVNGVTVFGDYKIPTPLDIEVRNFYFHSNESVNYLSVNRVFSKLFELQKTIYDSILSS